MSDLRATRKQRLFIALWPPARVVRSLAALAQTLHEQAGGRKIISQNQHVTLIFLGNVEAAGVVDVLAAMRQSAGAPFELQLDTIAYRRNGGMVWAGASQVPDVLHALVYRLRDALRARGYAVEDRPFVPHVTLVRDARRPVLPESAEIPGWRVSEITLVRSHLATNGVRYDIVGRVGLGGRAASA